MTESFEFLTVFNLLRIFGVLILAFALTMALMPWWIERLRRAGAGKQIKPIEAAPVFHTLHKHKDGTPTMGGVLIWAVVAIITLLFVILSLYFDGVFGKINFLSRSQTWLPFGALLAAGLLGAIDDYWGIKRSGPNGGGLRMRARVFFYLIIGAIGLLNFSVIGIAVVIAVAWVPSLFAFLTFSLLLTLKGEATLLKITLLTAPLSSSCLGIPGWTATIWPLVSKTIAANTIKKVAPGAVGQMASQALSGKLK